MNRIFSLFFFSVFAMMANAQTQPFGKVDTADLKLTTCDFEKGANAMVLFDKMDINTGFTSTTILRHTRIKILNDAGKDEASISIDYYSAHGVESINDIQAETINLDKNTIQYIKVDANAFYHQTVDKSTKKLTFTFPQVKAGSVIEYVYKTTIGFEGGFPDWDFQGTLPVRYCELKASIRNDFAYKMTPRVYQPYDQNTSSYWIGKRGDTLGKNYFWALKNINSYHEEAFSTGAEDDMQKMGFRLTGYRSTIRGDLRSLESSWFAVSRELKDDDDFGQQWGQDLKADDIISQAKALSSDEERISFIFDKVKNDMKWNGVNRWYTEDGIKKAWGKKQGNSTEINLVLYNLLKKAEINCYPEVVSTRSHGRVNTGYPSLRQFNKTVVYVSLVNKKSYLLDASDKYNNYQDIPYDILNTTGLLIKPDSNVYILSYLKTENPSRKVVFVNADISADSKMSGTTQINDFSYHKADAIRMYKTDGEQKYKDYLRDDDNNLKITSLKLDNMEVDSLPLTENIDFKLDLTGSDENYIYFSPNLFTGLNSNPFISEQRLADINFKYLHNYSINGRYKVPGGFKIEALPKSVALVMPDTSITFKRVVAEQDGYVIVRYLINFKRSYYPKEDYPVLRAFYKQLHEMLDEQIILKKEK